MSRYEDFGGDDEYGEARFNLWQANLRRALRSPRGRTVLTELREALLALPEHRLIEGALCTVDPAARVDALAARPHGHAQSTRDMVDDVVGRNGGPGVCLVGAYLWWKRVAAGDAPDVAFAAIPSVVAGLTMGDPLVETANAAKAAGMAYTLAWTLAYNNDEEWGTLTPEARWSRALEWVDGKLAAFGVAAG